jgi:hypothetical protein
MFLTTTQNNDLTRPNHSHSKQEFYLVNCAYGENLATLHGCEKSRNGRQQKISRPDSSAWTGERYKRWGKSQRKPAGTEPNQKAEKRILVVQSGKGSVSRSELMHSVEAEGQQEERGLAACCSGWEQWKAEDWLHDNGDWSQRTKTKTTTGTMSSTGRSPRDKQTPAPWPQLEEQPGAYRTETWETKTAHRRKILVRAQTHDRRIAGIGGSGGLSARKLSEEKLRSKTIRWKMRGHKQDPKQIFNWNQTRSKQPRRSPPSLPHLIGMKFVLGTFLL